jgi:hypothetical protein
MWMDVQMGHADGSVQAIYFHGTPELVDRLLAGLTTTWPATLGAQRALSPRPLVAALDRLLMELDG